MKHLKKLSVWLDSYRDFEEEFEKIDYNSIYLTTGTLLEEHQKMLCMVAFIYLKTEEKVNGKRANDDEKQFLALTKNFLDENCYE